MERHTLLRLVDELKSGKADDPYRTIHALGHEKFIEAKPVVESFLAHSDPALRQISLNVLTLHWMCKEHRGTCERFIAKDPDEDCRRMGVAGLGALFDGTRDSGILRTLLTVFRNEHEELSVRDSAYRQILYVLGRSAAAQPTAARRLDYSRDVNWNWIKEAEGIVKESHDQGNPFQSPGPQDQRSTD